MTSRASEVRRSATLGVADRAAAAELDHQPVAADRADLAGRQATLGRQREERGYVSGPGRQDQPRWAFAEQVDGRRAVDEQPDPCSAIPPDRALGQGDGQAAGGHVLGRGHETAPDRLADEALDGRLPGEVEPGRAVLRGHPGQLGVGAAGQARRRLADEDDRVAVGHELRPDEPADIVEQADDPDLGRRRDRPAGRLVVERDVAAGDRQVERPAGVGQAPDAFLELPECLRPGRVGVVQAVRHAERPGAGDRHVAGRLGHAQRRAEPRVDRADRLVRVGRRDQRLRRALDPQDCAP